MKETHSQLLQFSQVADDATVNSFKSEIQSKRDKVSSQLFLMVFSTALALLAKMHDKETVVNLLAMLTIMQLVVFYIMSTNLDRKEKEFKNALSLLDLEK